MGGWFTVVTSIVVVNECTASLHRSCERKLRRLKCDLAFLARSQAKYSRRPPSQAGRVQGNCERRLILFLGLWSYALSKKTTVAVIANVSWTWWRSRQLGHTNFAGYHSHFCRIIPGTSSADRILSSAVFAKCPYFWRLEQRIIALLYVIDCSLAYGGMPKLLFESLHPSCSALMPPLRAISSISVLQNKSI